MAKVLELIVAAALSLGISFNAGAEHKSRAEFTEDTIGSIILDAEPSKVKADEHKVIVYGKKGSKIFEEYCTSPDCSSNEFVAYYKNGQMASKGKHVNGKKEGVWFEWYNNGQLRWFEHYHRGKRHGTQMMWEKNGKLSLEQNMIDGKLHGRHVEWSSDNRCTISNYVSGKLHGERNWFNRFGKITHQVVYVRDKLLYP